MRRSAIRCTVRIRVLALRTQPIESFLGSPGSGPLTPGQQPALELKAQQEAATVALRRFFEMDRQYIAAAAISALSQQALVDPPVLEQCVARYGLSGGVLAPWLASNRPAAPLALLESRLPIALGRRLDVKIVVFAGYIIRP